MTGTSTARTVADLPERFNAAEDLIAPNLTVRPEKIRSEERRVGKECA